MEKKNSKKNRQIKLLAVVGARPNFIKIAPLFWELKRSRLIKPVLVHTGQHYDRGMSEIFFKDLQIADPDYNLGVGSASHAVQTAKTMIKLEQIFLKEKPDIVIIVGDVNSTLAAAVVAAKLHIPIGHIEAGPRMFVKGMPEEINRILSDHLSDFLFCPTRSSVNNLRKEGIKKGVYFTGDTMYDAFIKLLPLVKAREKRFLASINLEPKQFILLTAHRASNVDDLEKLEIVLQAAMATEEKIFFPVHPRTKKQLKKIIGKLKKLSNFPNLLFADPVGYTEMLILEKNAKKILTDSGGVQKEAYWLGVPCITILKKQGWLETFSEGWNKLVSLDEKKIVRAIKNLPPKTSRKRYFGDGKAAGKIVKIITNAKLTDYKD